jgi:hypothetical protein
MKKEHDDRPPQAASRKPPMLQREEYVEQAYFFGILQERIPSAPRSIGDNQPANCH